MESALKELPEMALMDHLKELRTRLIRGFCIVTVLGFSAYSYVPDAIKILSVPLLEKFPKNVLIGTGPAEAMTLRFSVSFALGLIVALPYIMWEIWGFISPALYKTEKKMILPFVGITTFCFLLGSFFSYKIILPITFGFFSDQYVELGLQPQIRISEHISLTIQLLIAFGLIFELPILSFVLARLGILKFNFLLNATRYIIAGIFIVSAILTPPDVVSQLLMAGPLLVMFVISLIVVKFTEKEI